VTGKDWRELNIHVPSFHALVQELDTLEEARVS